MGKTHLSVIHIINQKHLFKKPNSRKEIELIKKIVMNRQSLILSQTLLEFWESQKINNEPREQKETIQQANSPEKNDISKSSLKHKPNILRKNNVFQ
jgi:hypothetical protein